jgi:predicted phage terminase large subunit-like protein
MRTLEQLDVASVATKADGNGRAAADGVPYAAAIKVVGVAPILLHRYDDVAVERKAAADGATPRRPRPWKALANLDPVRRAQLETGDWSIRQGGAIFQRQWFRIVDRAPAGLRRVRFWDLAATAEPTRTDLLYDPDYTVGALLGQAHDGTVYVLDVIRRRLDSPDVKRLVRQTAELDGREVVIGMEQESGASGKAVIADYRRILAGFVFQPRQPFADKVTRAAPYASYAEGGGVRLVRAPWNAAFLQEHEQFPLGEHDDVVDGLSGGFNLLFPGARTRTGNALRRGPSLASVAETNMRPPESTAVIAARLRLPSLHRARFDDGWSRSVAGMTQPATSRETCWLTTVHAGCRARGRCVTTFSAATTRVTPLCARLTVPCRNGTPPSKLRRPQREHGRADCRGTPPPPRPRSRHPGAIAPPRCNRPVVLPRTTGEPVKHTPQQSLPPRPRHSEHLTAAVR